MGPQGRIGNDISHPFLGVEIKDRDKPLPRYFRDAIDQSREACPADKIPLIVWHTAGHHHSEDVVSLTLGDFERLLAALHQPDPL